ncbi:hypothetical protein CDAR_275081 [Caerostris darwini]|uniref:Secreted protein n=1 Tax=Caerostris darwini TaxID=1538125 RepID=A0AAV4U186_9ARAC|nr:hypothetical protein CDAR_275081 [Caerostris darwini]
MVRSTYCLSLLRYSPVATSSSDTCVAYPMARHRLFCRQSSWHLEMPVTSPLVVHLLVVHLQQASDFCEGRRLHTQHLWTEGMRNILDQGWANSGRFCPARG